MHSGRSEDAREMHRRAIVIDATCPLMGDPARWNDWIAGGATVAGPTVASRHTKLEALAAIEKWRGWIQGNPDRLLPVTKVADITRAKREAKLGVLFCYQDTTSIEWDLSLVARYYDLGVRMIGLTYNFRNRVADGCAEPGDAGLSEFGKAVVREMNRVGIVVDCSHTGYRTTMDAIEIASKPPVFSHANPRKLCDNRRNIWDDQAKAVAAKGGLVGMGGFPAFVSRRPDPTIKEFLDQLDYWVELVGADHVGLGLDYFNGVAVGPKEYQAYLDGFMWFAPDLPPPPYSYPRGIEDPTKLPNITAGLVERGYAEADILKILGGNWMRVFAANWVE